MAVAAKAVCLALVRHPEPELALGRRTPARSSSTTTSTSASPRRPGAGSWCPNIRDAEELTLVELADAIRRPRRDGARGQDGAGRDDGRHVLDHERRRLRRGRRNPDHQPGRGRHPGPRRRAASAVGVPRRDRAARRHDARACRSTTAWSTASRARSSSSMSPTSCASPGARCCCADRRAGVASAT